MSIYIADLNDPMFNFVLDYDHKEFMEDHEPIASISDEHKKALSEANSVPKPHVSKLMRERHAKGLARQWTSQHNPRSRKISAEGRVYNTIRECCNAYGLKNHNVIRYRLNHSKWDDWFYL